MSVIRPKHIGMVLLLVLIIIFIIFVFNKNYFPAPFIKAKLFNGSCDSCDSRGGICIQNCTLLKGEYTEVMDKQGKAAGCQEGEVCCIPLVEAEPEKSPTKKRKTLLPSIDS